MSRYYAIAYAGFIVPETVRRMKRDAIKAAEAYFRKPWEMIRNNPEYGSARATRVEIREASTTRRELGDPQICDALHCTRTMEAQRKRGIS